MKGPDIEYLRRDGNYHPQSVPFQAAETLGTFIVRANDGGVDVPPFEENPTDDECQRWSLNMECLNRCGLYSWEEKIRGAYSWDELRKLTAAAFCESENGIFWGDKIKDLYQFKAYLRVVERFK
jgi:hypothetical protein